VPFVFPILVLVAILTLWPGLVLFLPNALM
jgi:TRAP-type transport system large permease protein